MKFIKNNLVLCIISFIVSIVLGLFISRQLFPDYQFAILTGDKDYISIGTKVGIKEEVEEINGNYSVHLGKYLIGKELDIKYTKNDENIKNVIVNNKKIKTYKVDRYVNNNEKLILFTVNRSSNKFIISFISLSLLLTCFFAFIFGNDKYKILRLDIIKVIGKKHIIITSLVVLFSLFLVCGCDAQVIVSCAKWFSNGVDVYQYQVNSRNLLGTEYAAFPYNPISLLVYGGFFKILSPIIKNMPLIRNYPYFQVYSIKLLNLLFVQLTILYVLDFLYKNKKIEKNKLRLIYYLSFFNPVTFYVAFLFVQLDPLSLFLITTGLLFIDRIKENNYIGPVLVSLGIVIKTQLLVFLPLLLFSVLVTSFKNEKFKEGFLKLVSSGIVMFIVALCFFLSFTITDAAFHLVNSNLPQAQRIYYTIISYAESIFIYVSIFALGLLVFNYVFNLKLKMKLFNLTKANLLYLMILIFSLSSSIIPTPSVYVLSLPAFIILMYDEEDLLRILLVSFLSFGIVLLPMLSDYGDITILLSGFNKQSFLMNFYSRSENLTKLINIIFTVSATSMVAYICYSLTKANLLMKEED